MLFGSLTDYFTISSPTDIETRDAYLLASAVSLIAFIVVVIVGTAGYYGHKLGMLVRIICTSAIYDKVSTIRAKIAVKISRKGNTATFTSVKVLNTIYVVSGKSMLLLLLDS